ncbi:MAG: TorD/DmsD family molecular chaperone [Gammaproteobacteria bacterium]
MVREDVLISEGRSRAFWFLGDCFLHAPASTSEEIWTILHMPTDALDTLELRKEFARLFRGIKEGYGPPPPFESLYRVNEFPTDIIESVLGYFQIAGLNFADICEEPPDFLASEFRLMSLLAFQEHQSDLEGDDGQSRRYRELQNDFLNDHLLAWVPEYCRVLKETSRADFYRELAEYIDVFLRDIKIV